jgi:puromycin-sensitive aminopeptidase
MCNLHNRATHEIVNKHRLSANVKPIHYSITIRPDLKSFTFAGGEVIDIQVKKATSVITLNAVDLDITNVTVSNEKGSCLVANVVYDVEHEQVHFKFDGVVGKGRWKLSLNFAGEINNKLHGFYRSSYKDALGVEHVIVSTQFEPGDARRAFPCFDEPSFKARFTPRFVVDSHLDVLANGAAVSSTTVEEVYACNIAYGDGFTHSVPAVTKKVVTFKTSMTMSTYLVAWVIGEFESTEAIKVNGTKLRVLFPSGKRHMATVAQKSGQFALDYFEKYFGIRYPGGKLDMIAIPNFAFGAMENTGLITYRETALLVNEQTATINELMRVVEVVAHEIAHQWFGNLVTMEWWNGLWLNEAFATFMAAKVVEAYRKEWDRWTSFGVERAGAMRVDALLSSRAVEAPVVSSTAAQGAFDGITYRKGASVLRMLEQYIGEEAFRKGVARYLKEHSYGNTEGSDLWNALRTSSRKPVDRIMQGWVYQAGHPVVTVGQSELPGSITLAQRPFKFLSEQADTSLSWSVPVKLRYKNEDGEQSQWVLLSDREQTIYLGESLEWVVANAGGHGFYRTLYAPELAAKISADVQNTLSAIERFNLVNDAWACTQGGLQTALQYVDIVKLFGKETDPNVWSVISGSLSRLEGLLPSANKPSMQVFVRELAGSQLERLGWQVREGESIQDRQTRGTIISLLGTIGGDTAVQAKADELFTSYQADKSICPVDIVPAVVGLVAHTGDQADYVRFRQLQAATNVPQEQVRYIGALARFQDRELLATGLQSLLDGSVKSQDASSLAVGFLSNQVIRITAWEFVKQNWDVIVKTFPENGLISMIAGVTALDTPALEQDVNQFFATHKVKGGDKAVAQALEMLHVAVQFNQRETKALRERFPAAS